MKDVDLEARRMIREQEKDTRDLESRVIKLERELRRTNDNLERVMKKVEQMEAVKRQASSDGDSASTS